MPKGKSGRCSCSVDGCDKLAHSWGWCTTHHRRWELHGDPLKTLTPNRGKYKTCTYEECNKEHYCKGLCENHYRQERIRKNTSLRLRHRLSTRMYIAVKDGQKSGKTLEDLGCSIPHFKLYIENQFENGMSWDNYGEWHLDHVMPLAKFDLTNRTQFLEAANWLNYQPLWASKNLSKGAN